MSNIWTEFFSQQVLVYVGAGVVPRDHNENDAATLEILKNFAAQMRIDLAAVARDAFVRPEVVSDLQLLVFVLNKDNRQQLQRLFAQAQAHVAYEDPFRLLWQGIVHSTDDDGRCLEVADIVQCAALDLQHVRSMLSAALHMHQAQLKERGVETPGLSPALLMLEKGRQYRESVRQAKAQSKAAEVAWETHVQQRASSAALHALLGRTVGELAAEGLLHGWATNHPADHVLTPAEALEVLLEKDNIGLMSRCFSDNCFITCYCQCHGGHVPAAHMCVCRNMPRPVPFIDFGDAQRWPTAAAQRHDDDDRAWSGGGDTSGRDDEEDGACSSGSGGGGASGYDWEADHTPPVTL